jgi:hypothetical protein
MLANADDVPLVPVQGHGPTSLFKLLMGTTASGAIGWLQQAKW